ncbi:hypothetical protein BDL97_06G001900 [Sphagnum fallax]|nr:hypothetical protein BDL97_06G001900 [Sphagnum fallax]
MEDFDGGLSFDFEGVLEFAAVPLNAVASSGGGGGRGGVGGAASGRKNYRQTVCRHWLRGLCMNGDACGFLHQYDKARMPLCRFFVKFGECREPDCIYKHTNEDIKECNMYKLGFCPNGPDCHYRHQKLPGPPPLVEQNLQKLRHRIYAVNNNAHNGKFQSPCSQDGPLAARVGGWVPGEEAQLLHSVLPAAAQQLPAQTTPPHAVSSGLPNPPPFLSTAAPLPGDFCRYFIAKSSNRENLELSVEQGLWTIHHNNEPKVNEALDTCAHVILVF